MSNNKLVIFISSVKTIMPCWFFLILVSCSYVEVRKEVPDKYSYFEKTEVFEETKVISLNNFKTRYKKEGLEYLLNYNFQLLEARTWSNNHINGYVILYASNGNPKIVSNFVNDTVSGNYFLLDSLTGKLITWKEKLNMHDGFELDNQVIQLNNDSINYDKSNFYLIERANSDLVRIKIFGSYFYDSFTCQIKETDDALEEIKITQDSQAFNFKNNTLEYKIKNKYSKYIIGRIFNYMIETDTLNKVTKADTIGVNYYFKKQL